MAHQSVRNASIRSVSEVLSACPPGGARTTVASFMQEIIPDLPISRECTKNAGERLGPFIDGCRVAPMGWTFHLESIEDATKASVRISEDRTGTEQSNTVLEFALAVSALPDSNYGVRGECTAYYRSTQNGLIHVLSKQTISDSEVSSSSELFQALIQRSTSIRKAVSEQVGALLISSKSLRRLLPISKQKIQWDGMFDVVIPRSNDKSELET